MEHSAAAAKIDVRALPVNQYDETIDEGRELHDSCDHLPGKYAPLIMLLLLSGRTK